MRGRYHLSRAELERMVYEKKTDREKLLEATLDNMRADFASFLYSISEPIEPAKPRE